MYTGVEWNYAMGVIKLNLLQVLPQDLYHEGDGKDLGHALEFKTEVQLSYSTFQKVQI